jgi:hypothetical protein
MFKMAFKHIIRAVLLAVVLGLSGQVPLVSADGGVSISISPEAITKESGETFTVDLIIDSGSTKIRGWQGGILFDPAILACKNVKEGSFLKKMGQSVTVIDVDKAIIDNDNGQVTDIAYAAMSQQSGGASGSGVLCTFTFTAKKGSQGSTEISPVDVILADADVNAVEDVTLNSGIVEIIETHPEVKLGLSSPAGGSRVNASTDFNIVVSISTSDLISRGAGLSLQYDASKVSCKQVEEGGFFTDDYSFDMDPPPVIDNDSGEVGYFQINVTDPDGGPSGNGYLCTFHMRTKTKTGDLTITLENGVVLDEEGIELSGITLKPESISITVISSEGGSTGGGNTPSPVPTPSVTPVATVNPSPSPTVTKSNTPAAITSPTPTGTSKPQITPAPETPDMTPVSEPATVVAAIPTTAEEDGAGTIADNNETLIFDLKGQLNSKGAVVNDFSEEKTLDETGTVSISLKIENGTVVLNRQKKPLESIRIARIEPAQSLPQRSDLVMVFDCGPSGSTFSMPVTFTLKYDPSAIPEDIQESNLKLAVYDAQKKQWAALDSKIDETNHSISAGVSQYSTLALMTGVGSGLNWIIFVITGVVLILIIAIVIWFLRLRKPQARVSIEKRNPPKTNLGNYLNNNLPNTHDKNNSSLNKK